MSVSSDSAGGSTGDALPNEEARMRRALGLTNEAPAREQQPSTAPRPQQTEPRLNSGGSGQLLQRRDADRRPRRFVRDGEVPVVVVNGAKL